MVYSSRCWTQLTKLGRLFPVYRSARPIVGPSDVPVLSQRNHRLNGKGHARLALSHSLVLGVMRDVRRAVEDGVDAVADVGPDHTAVLALGVLLDMIAKVAEQRAWLDVFDGLFQTLACGLNHAHSVRIRTRLVAHVVGLVKIAVVALVVQCHI